MALIWTSLVPKKCKFFIWSLFHKGINTIDKCQSRSPHMALNPNWCVLCKANNETMEHIFVNCTFTQHVWGNFFHFVDSSTTAPTSLDDVPKKFCYYKPSTKRSILLQNMIGATFWIIWLERNGRTFNDGGKSQRQIWDDVLNFTALWCLKSKLFCSYNTAAFLSIGMLFFSSLSSPFI